MSKNVKNHHKELKNAVACVLLKEKNIAQKKRGAMLKNLQKRCEKYVIPIIGLKVVSGERPYEN